MRIINTFYTVLAFFFYNTTYKCIFNFLESFWAVLQKVKIFTSSSIEFADTKDPKINSRNLEVGVLLKYIVNTGKKIFIVTIINPFLRYFTPTIAASDLSIFLGNAN